MPEPRPLRRRPAVPPRSVRPRVTAAALLALVFAYALAWPQLAPADWSESDYLRAGVAPSWPNVMGADSLGHDLTVRVAQALQVSLAVAAGSALAATLIGIAVGAAAAAGGARLDGVLMRVTDAVAAVPHLLATVVVVALFRGSVTALVLALALTHWPAVARIVRAETQKVMTSGYVAASRVAGASPSQLVRHHVLPAVAGQAGLAVVVMLPHAVWHESTLSFLGVGLPPEEASLGTLIALARADLMLGRWWALAFPAAALVVVTVAVSLLAPAAGRGGRAARRPVLRRPTLRRAAERRAAGRVTNTNRDDDGATRPLPGPTRSPAALTVFDLTVRVPTADGPGMPLLDRVSLTAHPGEVLMVLGESGAGKSTLANACCGLLPRGAQVSGQIALGAAAQESRGVAGHVPQSTSAAFTPTRHVRTQLEEILAAARGPAGRSVAELCLEVGLDPALVERYPHQLSGGQLRRAAIAAALATGPTVLIADEPTVGLDPQTALAVLRLLRRLAAHRGLAVTVISHDLAALCESRAADTVAVLRSGRIGEWGPAGQVLTDPEHEYTREFVAAALPTALPTALPVTLPASLLVARVTAS